MVDIGGVECRSAVRESDGVCFIGYSGRREFVKKARNFLICQSHKSKDKTSPGSLGIAKQGNQAKTGMTEGGGGSKLRSAFPLRTLASCIGIKPLSLRRSRTANWSANLERSEDVPCEE